MDKSEPKPTNTSTGMEECQKAEAGKAFFKYGSIIELKLLRPILEESYFVKFSPWIYFIRLAEMVPWNSEITSLIP